MFILNPDLVYAVQFPVGCVDRQQIRLCIQSAVVGAVSQPELLKFDISQ